jgi:ABC-type polysaccharide/polyol phosphate export permease
MGVAWVFFMPFLYGGAGLVINRFAKFDTGNVPYPLFMLIGILPWTFFISALKFSTTSLISNMQLITKIYFPREVLPLSAINACFVDFIISCLLVAGAFVFYAIQGSVHITAWVLLVPVVMIFQIMLTAGLCLLLAMGNLFLRDIKYIVDGLLTVGIFATSVYYPLGGIFLLNPMTAIINVYRDLLAYGHAPDWSMLSYIAAVSSFTMLTGWLCFHKGEFLFAENI